LFICVTGIQEFAGPNGSVTLVLVAASASNVHRDSRRFRYKIHTKRVLTGVALLVMWHSFLNC
jgi:hypothetical protein